jgi:SSS family solute:Na+ symporter
MNLIIFALLLFGLQGACMFVGRKAAKQRTSKEEYFLAGKSVRFFPLMMTFLATQVGGGLVLGSADEAYKYGWSVLLYPLGAALGMVFLSMGIGRRLAQFRVSTVAQILEVKYGSVGLKRAASLLSIVSLFMILVAQVVASGKFLNSIGFSSTPLFMACWALVIIYTVRGGFRGVVAADMVQALFFIAVFIVAFGWSLSSGATFTAADTVLVPTKLWGWLLMPLLFMLIEQDMAQRCFAGASPRIVSKAALVAGIGTLLIGTIPVLLGVYARSIGLDVSPGTSVLMASITATTNPTIAACVGCAVLAAITSTAISLINAIGSNVSADFNLTRVRLITTIVSLGAILFSFYSTSVISILVESYELSVSCLFAPIFIALFKKRCSPLSALLSILFGAASFTLFHIWSSPLPREVTSVILSLLGYGLGEVIARRAVLRDRVGGVVD